MGRSFREFTVYEVDKFGDRHWLGDTWAVSPEQAINNVRFRLWGDTSVAELEIEFDAEAVVESATKPSRQTLPRLAKANCPRERQLVFSDFLRRQPVY